MQLVLGFLGGSDQVAVPRLLLNANLAGREDREFPKKTELPIRLAQTNWRGSAGGTDRQHKTRSIVSFRFGE